MVKVRGRNSNGKTVKQTVKNGRKISGDDAARPAWVTGARRQQFAAASRFWSIPNLMPRSTVTRVWLTEWAHLGQLCGTLSWYIDIWQSFRECCLTRQWQSAECDTRYMVQRKKFDVREVKRTCETRRVRFRWRVRERVWCWFRSDRVRALVQTSPRPLTHTPDRVRFPPNFDFFFDSVGFWTTSTSDSVVGLCPFRQQGIWTLDSVDFAAAWTFQ